MIKIGNIICDCFIHRLLQEHFANMEIEQK
jgi:hypothetical protein